MFKQKLMTLFIGTGIVVAAMRMIEAPYLLWAMMTVWLVFAVYVGVYPNETRWNPIIGRFWLLDIRYLRHICDVYDRRSIFIDLDSNRPDHRHIPIHLEEGKNGMNRDRLLTFIIIIALLVILLLYLNLWLGLFSFTAAGMLALCIFLLLIAAIWLVK